MSRRLILAMAGTGAVLSASFAMLPDALAGGFVVRTQSAAGFGTSLAGVAAGDQLSYSFWNPAVLSNIQGFELEGNFTAIFPSFDIMPDDATSLQYAGFGGTPDDIDVGNFALVPSTFAAMQLNERVTLGLAMTSPFGLATEAPNDWAGQVYSRDSEIFSLNVNPMVSYRINDMISVGAGAQFEYFRAYLSQATGPVPGDPDASLKADDIGVGFNLGIQLHPWDGTSIGVGYRSSIEHDLDGRLLTPLDRIPVGTTLDTPEIVSFGIEQRITDRFRAMGTVEWNNWSRLGTLPIVNDSGTTETTLYLNYRDGWLFSLGGEYDYSDKLTLRAGIGYEIAPITTDNRDTRLPETDQFMLSAGFTYKYSDFVTLNASYLHSFGVGDGEIDIQAGDDQFLGVPFSGDSDLSVGILSVGLNVKFGAPPPPPPLITK